jgi:hypothetical protein
MASLEVAGGLTMKTHFRQGMKGSSTLVIRRDLDDPGVILVGNAFGVHAQGEQASLEFLRSVEIVKGGGDILKFGGCPLKSYHAGTIYTAIFRTESRLLQC